MELNISNRKTKIRLAVIVALVAFSTIFLLTGAIMTSVYGLKPLDPGYIHTEPNTPYEDLIENGCISATETMPDASIVVFDTKGLEELGLPYYDQNICFDIAKTMDSYNIEKIEPYKITGQYGNDIDQMKITLTKK
jgi:hypothetical protein